MSWAWCRGESFRMFNTFDWEYLRSKISELDSTGTETNPSLITAPTISLIRESPLKYFESDLILSTNPKDYKKVLYVENEKWQWDWTFDGLQQIKKESNLQSNQNSIGQKLETVLAQLYKDDYEAVYATTVGKDLSFVIGQQASPRSLHHYHNSQLKTGGIADSSQINTRENTEKL
jgi:hypothetical protein